MNKTGQNITSNWDRVAGVGWLSGSATKSLRAFVERVFANFRDKNIVFYNRAETGNLWLSRDYYERRISFVESSTKAGCLSVKALGKQDVFR